MLLFLTGHIIVVIDGNWGRSKNVDFTPQIGQRRKGFTIRDLPVFTASRVSGNFLSLKICSLRDN